MRFKRLEVIGFKSFARKSVFEFSTPITAVVGPNGSGKSNVTEAIRFVLGEQSMKSMRGKKGDDLIFNGSEKAGRLNHAKTTITFDNEDRAFSLDFDEVILSREVYRDGTNKYSINGSPVRLKDIIELLASVHIGASSHHIISQGEADRVLNASPRERRAMIEDALGLKIYHWKIEESEKKLARTEENLKEVELLRREIAPQIRYLAKQVEKAKEANTLRSQLEELAGNYLAREKMYLDHEAKVIDDERVRLETDRARVEGNIKTVETSLKEKEIELPEVLQLQEAQGELAQLRMHKGDCIREIGKAEGAMEAARRRQERLTRDAKEQPRVRIAHEALSGFMGAIEDAAAAICDTMEIGKIHDVARQLGDGARERREEWLGSNKSNDEEIELIEEEIRMLKAEQSKWEDKRVSIEQDEAHLGEKVLEIQGRIDEARAGLVEDERHLLEYRAEGERIAGQLQGILSQERQYLLENEDYARELNEIEHMLGAHALNEAYVELDTSEVLQEERRVQLDRRRELERVKIRLEDIGGTATNADTLKEFEEEQARDNFLAHEIEDLTASATSLRVLIDDLRKKLDTEFIGGIEKINAKFQQFFEVMFGGGSAALDVVEERVRGRRKNVEDTETIPDEIGDDDEETTTGIDIAVSLPRKKVRGLMMLSGGERALTSIALLFAMSQVNPPPFMILDETDAALDESNSRKYGDMLKNLSEVSQLIVVTHNRETMSRAGILYGVTMAADAVSQVLSVKFDEALKVAK